MGADLIKLEIFFFSKSKRGANSQLLFWLERVYFHSIVVGYLYFYSWSVDDFVDQIKSMPPNFNIFGPVPPEIFPVLAGCFKSCRTHDFFWEPHQTSFPPRRGGGSRGGGRVAKEKLMTDPTFYVRKIGKYFNQKKFNLCHNKVHKRSYRYNSTKNPFPSCATNRGLTGMCGVFSCQLWVHPIPFSCFCRSIAIVLMKCECFLDYNQCGATMGPGRALDWPSAVRQWSGHASAVDSRSQGTPYAATPGSNCFPLSTSFLSGLFSYCAAFIAGS